MDNSLIYRQAALGSVNSWRAEYPLNRQEPLDDCENSIRELPAVEAIPVAWIEAKITRLISMDNEFAGLTVHIIKTMLDEWKEDGRNRDD